ncbi:hypothetical protein [Maribellus maritimus]|uniref:hypothetical protein n=1 Tax=Maribellus maritimus TaxID=2870838 RepID=UPI001EEAD2A1|nr:hypothetical protein [Maribellus maritimus]MCG6190426.1 hypothetical protein [Maribellus maritimus]
MKHFIPFAFFLFVFITTNAQFENIDLSTYKLPEIKRHQLDFSLQYANSYSKSSYEDNPDVSIFILNNNLKANYSYYFNSDRIQMNGWSNLSSDINLNWEDAGDVRYVKDDSYNFYFDGGFDKRIYFNNDDRWFFFWSPVLNTYSYSDYEKDIVNEDEDDKYYSRSLFLNPEMEVGGGIGRIEQIGDLRRAIYIYI